ncbi:MAG TPA: glycosyltransferase family 2 protein [Actinomycetota bacterium]|nr:glycosyltransferase family 2 protein [Actinomycetota bacterium]
MNVVAVVLNWKRAAETIACIASVRATSPQTEIIVIDNASGDGSAERIRASHPDIELIENSANLGFAGGNNVGIAAALARRTTSAVFVLNNDVIVQDGCISTLVDAMERFDPNAGIVGPLSLLADGVTVDFADAGFDLRAMALTSPGRDERWDGNARPRSPSYVTGSAMLVRREVFEQVGPFDERFFLVWEDVDLSMRAGTSSHDGKWIVPAARVLHARSVSFGGDGAPLFQYFYVRNSFLMLDKHVRWPWKRRTHAMLERRYRGWLDKAETTAVMREAIARGLEDGLAQRWGPPPDDLRT